MTDSVGKDLNKPAISESSSEINRNRVETVHILSWISVKVPILCVWILHIRILWIFPIKNVIYLTFEKFHLS